MKMMVLAARQARWPLHSEMPTLEISLGKQEVPDPPHLEATPWA